MDLSRGRACNTILYFTNVQVIFRCTSSVTYEDACYPSDTVTAHDNGLHKTFSKSRFQDFAAHLGSYTYRSLSYQSDVYNAMTGIMRALYGKDCEFIYGLPQEDFDRTLLWYPSWQFEFRPLDTNEVVCPTWSWSSAMKHSEDASYQVERKLYGTLVVWYRATNLPLLTDCQLQAINLSSKTEMDGDWALHMAIACEEGLLENVSATWSSKKDSFLTIRERSQARWPNYLSYCKELENSACFPQAVKQALKPGILLAKAQSGSFRLRFSSRGSYLHIVDLTGDFIGKIHGSATRLKSEIRSPSYDEHVLHEFVAISLTDDYNQLWDIEEKRAKDYYDVENTRLSCLLVVNVLMIGWRGQYAYRKAVGWIALKDWIKVERKWKMVLLE